jgi:hypothetical protein
LPPGFRLAAIDGIFRQRLVVLKALSRGVMARAERRKANLAPDQAGLANHIDDRDGKLAEFSLISSLPGLA